MSKLECVHVDTCLPDYWGGHRLPHVQIPVHNGMSLREVKEALHSELHEGAVLGSDAPNIDLDEDVEKWYYRAHAAVNRIKPAVKGQRRFFTDIEESDNDDMAVYAFFVFVGVE